MARWARAAAVVCGLTLLAGAVPAAAQTSSNDAVAVNQHDGKSVFKLAFSIKKNAQTADAQNAAVAYASCTDCKTVAAAIQVVLVANEDDSASPTNTAIAINYQCSECDTLAAAYQFVFASGEPVKLTPEGKAELNDIKHRFHDLKKRDDLTIDELAAQIAELAGEVAHVVDTQTVPKHPDDAETTTSATNGNSTTTASEPTTTAGTDTTEAPTTIPPTSSSQP